MWKAALAFAATLVAVWLLGAFIAWELNPGLWSVDGRFGAAFFGVSTAVTVAIYAGLSR